MYGVIYAGVIGMYRESGFRKLGESFLGAPTNEIMPLLRSSRVYDFFFEAAM